MTDAQEYAQEIRDAIMLAEAAGFEVHVEAKGYPDPTEERLVVAKAGSPTGVAWHWRYDDD